tara:strand:- start:6473 stop:6940 length:468 start_codon:yes stop_codon:yes gene_type:complete
MAKKIREIMPNCGLSTDIIVGFPGETDEQFRETLDLMEKIKFNSAYTFKYSPRPYTKAEQFSEQIEEQIKKDRLDEMINLQRKHTLELNMEKVGNFEQVLIEKESKKSTNHWAGRTDSNEWVIVEKNNSKIKDIIPVEIIEAKGVILRGKEITGA